MMGAKMPEFELRAMQDNEWSEVAALIYDSINTWYRNHGFPEIFRGPKDVCRLFCEVYERIDPGRCLVAFDPQKGCLAGSCFYHPRTTHVSLGIMNVHPDYFGRGVGSQLLRRVIELADAEHKPMRLVSSALNLDSFSLYNRAGFRPHMVFQDMLLLVPETGLSIESPGLERVRPATLADVPRMVALEREVAHIEREADLRYFVENPDGHWHASVIEAGGGSLAGFLVSIAHPAVHLLGPGVMRDAQDAVALIAAELDLHRGASAVWLVPCDCDHLVRTMYAWGAVNCELHFGQSRGAWTKPDGIVMPTFMPETG
jgi:GNAT superfamily N-acetyltransferase